MVEHGIAKYSWLVNVVKTTFRQGHDACHETVESPCDLPVVAHDCGLV